MSYTQALENIDGRIDDLLRSSKKEMASEEIYDALWKDRLPITLADVRGSIGRLVELRKAEFTLGRKYKAR